LLVAAATPTRATVEEMIIGRCVLAVIGFERQMGS
jgi:hypothetical protein